MYRIHRFGRWQFRTAQAPGTAEQEACMLAQVFRLPVQVKPPLLLGPKRHRVLS